MIKLVFCLRHLRSLSIEQVQIYWREKHAPLVFRHAATLGIRRYVQSHSFADARLSGALTARGEVPPYDGVAELWFDNEEAPLSIANNPAARRAGRELLEDERRFIDLAHSPLFYTREHSIVTLSPCDPV